MASEKLLALLREAVESPSFAAQLGSDATILTGYDLAPEEREALVAHDEQALRRLGVPEELVPGVRAIARVEEGI